MPIAANCHGLRPAKIPWLAADAARMPSRKAPLTLTTTVPHGNVSPTRRATNPDSQNLAVPPSTLPRVTHMTPLIVSTACLDLFSHAAQTLPGSIPGNSKHAAPSAHHLRLAPTQQLDFALRRPRGLSGRIAMA